MQKDTSIHNIDRQIDRQKDRQMEKSDLQAGVIPRHGPLVARVQQAVRDKDKISKNNF